MSLQGDDLWGAQVARAFAGEVGLLLSGDALVPCHLAIPAWGSEVRVRWSHPEEVVTQRSWCTCRAPGNRSAEEGARRNQATEYRDC